MTNNKRVTGFDITIGYLAQPKQADRSRIVDAKGGRFVRHYQSAKVKKNAQSLVALIAQQTNVRNLRGPLCVRLDFQYPWRTSEPKKNRSIGSLPKDTKPDVDNLAKAVLDALQSLFVFADDAQIADLHVTKEWSSHAGLRIQVKGMK